MLPHASLHTITSLAGFGALVLPTDLANDCPSFNRPALYLLFIIGCFPYSP